MEWRKCRLGAAFSGPMLHMLHVVSAEKQMWCQPRSRGGHMGDCKKPDPFAIVFLDVIFFSSCRFPKRWLHILIKESCFLCGVSAHNRHDRFTSVFSRKFCISAKLKRRRGKDSTLFSQLAESSARLDFEELLDKLEDVDWVSPFQVAMFLGNHNFFFSALRAWLFARYRFWLVWYMSWWRLVFPAFRTRRARSHSCGLIQRALCES